MKKIYWERIIRAVQSIDDCTNPIFQSGKIQAIADRLRSEYRGRHSLKFQTTDNNIGRNIIACSSRYTIAIQLLNEELPSPVSKDGLVQEWQGGLVPTQIVLPVLEKAHNLGLLTTIPSDELIKVYVLTPTLAGWYYTHPVFWWADDNNKPVKLTGEPEYTQGSLRVGWKEMIREELSSARWNENERFFNHFVKNRGEDTFVFPEKNYSRPVALIYQKEIYAATFLVIEGNDKEIGALDHPGVPIAEGEYLAIHPLVAGKD